MSRFTVPSGGAILSARIDGDDGKPWMILSNSLAADLHMWDGQVEALTRTHRLLRYDTRGHGQSTAPEGPYDFAMLVANMVALLDHVGADRADVMGLSLGGMTALGLGLTHPGRVGRMVVSDARADNPPPFVASWDERIAAISAGGMEAIREGTLSRWFTPRCPAEIRDRAGAMILATSVAGYTGCAQALKRLDYLRHLHEMTVPVLYVVGAEDMGAPPAAMQAMADATPKARLVTLPGLAHVPNMENPDLFNDAVIPWFDTARTA
jgi:3-oxoadipate enol-lactonase